MTDEEEAFIAYLAMMIQIYTWTRVMLWFGVNVAHRIDVPFITFDQARTR